jgi:hypothetical protein
MLAHKLLQLALKLFRRRRAVEKSILHISRLRFDERDEVGHTPPVKTMMKGLVSHDA